VKQEHEFSVSPHFEVEELGNGIFAAIHKEGGGAICNAGIIDLGDRTLIFDTFLTPQAAGDLKSAAEALTGKSATIVVNSHSHNDHIWGNQVFESQADIISTGATKECIATEGINEFEWYKSNVAERLASLESQYESADDDAKRGELSLWLTYYQQLADAMSSLAVVLPTLTFDERLILHGSTRTAELIEYRNGHTNSDIILLLKQDSIVFMGDLLFVESHPYLGDGQPEALVKILEEIRSMDANIFVPGHGPIGNKVNLQMLIDYIEVCQDIVNRMVSDGQSEEDVDRIAIPESFKSWQQAGFFRSNLHFLYKKTSGRK